MDIIQLDHLVLTVKNIEKTCQFYQKIFGFQVIEFGQGRKALKFGHQKFNLHQAGKEFEPKANNPLPGAIDLCLISDTPLDTVVSELKQHDIPIEDGPVHRTGATGKLVSVYIRDPDLNLIEISNHV